MADLDSVRDHLEQALTAWKDGHYGGLLYYYDGRGPLGRDWRERMDTKDKTGPRPAEWSVVRFECETERACTAIALVKFTDENKGGLRRYRLARQPGTFWGLVDEQRMQCPQGYRLQYQGSCLNVEDEQSDEPDAEVRSAEPIAAD